MSAKCYLGLLDSVVRSAERLGEGELHCLGHRKVIDLCLLCKIYHSVTHHHVNECVHHFVEARNARALAALGEIALVIPRCITGHFSRLAAVCLLNLLPSGVFRDGTLSSFKNTMNLCLLRA